MIISRSVQLASRPIGMPERKNFQIVSEKLPALEENQFLVRNLCMSVDPYMRGRMMDRKSYIEPFQVGKTLAGGAIGQVEESRHPDYKPGDHVQSMFGWREAFLSSGDGVFKLGELSAPPSAYLGVLGMPGLTAYAGLLEVGQYRDGETVFVSGAAGAVGSLVGQIARLKGSRVIGSAGSAAKVAYLRTELGFDYAFDYHDGDLLAHLREGAPDGLDIYFDNVGGAHLQAALFHMRPKGRIPLCGAISRYNDTEPAPGPNNLMLAIGLELTLRGFIVTSHMHLQEAFVRDVGGWIASGQVRYKETIHQGVENAPDAFIGLFSGANIGKMIVNL